ncbi:MAG: PQQ-dependent sugar dehydrogenase [Opitutaceae bacterium]|nr:PQQ-dependent sugar dehydrogenase [Opitutaceae bacterium]
MISRFLSTNGIAALLALTLGAGVLGAATREPWTTSRIEGSPEPLKPFVAEPVSPALVIAEGLELMPVPGARRWLVVERRGKILSFSARGHAESADLVIDLLALHPRMDTAYSVVLHPRYRENRQIFVCYAMTQGLVDGSRVSRFTLSSLEPLRVDPASEEILLTWRSGGHNGCSLRFGPDGFLYISTGDAGPAAPPDLYDTGQDPSDLEGSILRIDVDQRDPGRRYRVPPDNPWVAGTPSTSAGGTAAVRPELWAYGLRNPWRMSFDRVKGDLWCGDIGWELWEMVHLIQRGGNYGWAAFEASQPIKPDRVSRLAPITKPVIAHPHAEAASITGGYVYHGKQYPELAGAYIYGDYVTGKIWALWYDGRQVTRHEEIADTPHSIIAFGEDDDGELYYLHYPGRSSLHRLVRNPQAAPTAPFPRTLAATGLFADTARRVPAPGVYPFEVATPVWEDGARAERLIALRGTSALTTTVQVRPARKAQARRTEYTTTWPAGAVLARTLTLGALAPSAAERDRPVETQVLHYDGETWNAYAYRWNDAGTDADLVPAEGAEFTLRVAADPHAPGPRTRDYTWRIEGRAECLRCHSTWNKGALAFTAAQLSGAAASQRTALLERGLVNEHFFEPERTDPAGTDAEAAARAYLHINCATCHSAHAGGAVAIFLGRDLTRDEMKLVGVAPAQGGLGLKQARLIDPGDPWNSVIAVRMAKLGAGHMPLIGSRDVDVEGLKLIEDWIARMPAEKAAPKPWAETRWDAALLERELATVSGAMRVRRAIDDGKIDADLRAAAYRIAWASPEPTVRDIFERFKPDELRERTLGAVIDPAAVLRLTGDAARGARLVAGEGKLASCQACHVIRGQGRHFGPDLSRIGAQQGPAQILESLLSPSKVIAPLYRATRVELRDGSAHLGFVRARGASELVLSIPGGQSVKVRLADIAAEKTIDTSLMPEGQLQGLTPQEAADLIAYLASLR